MVNQTTSVPIVLAFTENYLIPAATCLKSILDSSDFSDTFHVICLLTNELSVEMKQLLFSLDNSRLSFTFINLEDKLKDIYINDRFTVAASYRLLLPELLPSDDKVIYLDCDIIVRNNLAKLYRSVDLKGFLLAAVFEAILPYQVDYIKKIGLEDNRYFNSGFLLMNLDKMRSESIVYKLLEASNNQDSNFPDQDALNIVCKGKVLGLAPRYNSIRTFYVPQYKSNFLKYYTLDDWKEVQSIGNIHYTGGKPWERYTIHFDKWWGFYFRLPIDLRSHMELPTKLSFYYQVYKYPIGKFLIENVKRVIRIIKPYKKDY